MMKSHQYAVRAVEMDGFKTFETDFAAPFPEVRRGVIKRVAELDQGMFNDMSRSNDVSGARVNISMASRTVPPGGRAS